MSRYNGLCKSLGLTVYLFYAVLYYTVLYIFFAHYTKSCAGHTSRRETQPYKCMPFKNKDYLYMRNFDLKWLTVLQYIISSGRQFHILTILYMSIV